MDRKREHGKDGHLNIFTLDQDSVVTGFGAHYRVVAFQPDSEGLYCRVDHLNGDRKTRTFFCPPDGGYVRETDAAGRYPQVCDGLCSQGSTLIAASRASLPALIRREYRRMRRGEAALAAAGVTP